MRQMSTLRVGINQLSFLKCVWTISWNYKASYEYNLDDEEIKEIIFYIFYMYISFYFMKERSSLFVVVYIRIHSQSTDCNLQRTY